MHLHTLDYMKIVCKCVFVRFIDEAEKRKKKQCSKFIEKMDIVL